MEDGVDKYIIIFAIVLGLVGIYLSINGGVFLSRQEFEEWPGPFQCPYRSSQRVLETATISDYGVRTQFTDIATGDSEEESCSEILEVPGCDTSGGGQIYIDCSCAGRPAWIVPEDGDAYTCVECGKWIDADAIEFDNILTKVTDNTCSVLTCPSPVSNDFESCCSNGVRCRNKFVYDHFACSWDVNPGEFCGGVPGCSREPPPDGEDCDIQCPPDSDYCL